MKNSLKEKLVKYLADERIWLSKGHVTDTMKWKYVERGFEKTYLSETAGRKCREAEEESRLAVRPKGSSIEYKFIPPDLRKFYIPYSQRTDKSVMWRK